MGHAGAIVSGNKGTAQGKMEALTAAGAHVANNPTELGGLVAKTLANI
jgi:succinyl-CoA synthetase alpha subunit